MHALNDLVRRLLPELTELQTRALQSELAHVQSRPMPAPAPVAGLPERLGGFD